MRIPLRVITTGLLVFLTSGALVSLHAQTISESHAAVNDTASETAPPASPASPDNSAYMLKKGDNEFGFWGGASFAATTVFGGLHEDEASNRRFVIAAFRYGRTLFANKSVALQYTLDAIPLAVATGNIKSETTVGTVTILTRGTAYGAGVTPLGLQLDFRNGSHLKPFIHLNGGLLVFNESMPLPDAGKLALVGETGAGLRIFTSDRRAVSLGVRFHHISNGDRAGSNRGLNQFIFYAGFSIFK
jgi:hypothetical protein